jgi:uncharacterized membrane protein
VNGAHDQEVTMATFTAWKFDTPEGAAHAQDLLEAAEAEHLVKVLDHAVVTWPEGEKAPRTRQGRDSQKRGTGRGAFWGLLFGSVFLMPVVGAAVGASVGALRYLGQGVSLTQEQIEEIRTQLVPGTSALFAITDEGNLDRLGERFRGMHTTLVATNLTPAERSTVMELFGEGSSDQTEG